MSDDLISRKAIYKAISDYLNRSRLGETSAQTDLRVGEIASIIHDVPTAFDKEKVIEEIKEYSKTVPLYWNCNGGDLVNKIIDIIEKGGVE